MGKKVAVVIFNLGGPDRVESIEPFLYNFFMDPNIIRLPPPLRFPLAKLISRRRSRKEALESYNMLDGRSPLLENTKKQADLLAEVLNAAGDGADYKTYICMRYWHPMAEETARAVKADDPDHVVLLPFYPQYSTTTTRSSLGVWNKAASEAGLSCPAALVCCYPLMAGFIKASARLVKDAYEKALSETEGQNLPPPRVLFSAHGLPESVIKDGDPYQWQCEKTAEAIVREMDMKVLDWVICYQSRVGLKKWIGPSTEEEIERAGRDGVPVIIYPHAFVNEHVETLVEIEMEYRALAQEKGVPWFSGVSTVGENRLFIENLAGLVRRFAQISGISSALGERLCPSFFKRCCMKEGILYQGNKA